MGNQGPFHEGELEAQRLAGESLEAERNSPMIGDRIMAGAVGFLSQQAMAIMGSRDSEERLWSSILFGKPGFLAAGTDRRSLQIRVDAELKDNRDPLWANLAHDPRVGILAIELATRRRIRINGRMEMGSSEFLTVAVEESFANCPKYIQRREIRIVGAMAAEEPREKERFSVRLNSEERELIKRADMFFVTSAHPMRGLDTSHRGGNSGFVDILDGETLRIPDYAGNSMFNTIGNFLTDSHAGLVFPDFEHHRLLQLAGKVDVLWEQLNGTDGDTGRSWLFSMERARLTAIPAAVQSRFVDYSPYNPTVG